MSPSIVVDKNQSMGLNPCVCSEWSTRSEGIPEIVSDVSVLKSLQRGPIDPILGLNSAFKQDPSEIKINLGVGAYRDSEGKPYIFEVVKKAEQKFMEDQNRNYEYLPEDGSPQFISATQKLIFGADSELVQSGRVATVQSLSGTGALYLAGELLKLTRDMCGGALPNVWLPDPTWKNHQHIFTSIGLPVRLYRYFDSSILNCNVGWMLEDIVSGIKERADGPHCVVLHACGHNPTGCDPTKDQWGEIRDGLALIARDLKTKIVILMDIAYQGFCSGDVNEDASALRMMARVPEFEVVIAQSLSKNMGLYSLRIGALHWVCQSKGDAAVLQSRLRRVCRAVYSNPPSFSAYVASFILNDLFEDWCAELKTVAGRIQAMRKLLKAEVDKAQCKGNWDVLVGQTGMFTYTGLSPAQCARLTEEFHIYLTADGRISMAGVTEHNVKAIAQAFAAVCNDKN